MKMNVLVTVVFLLGALAGCNEKVPQKPKYAFKINGIELVIPNDWKDWRVQDVRATNGLPPYQKLLFTLDIDTYENVVRDSDSDNQIDVELRPIRSEFGEKRYWTATDRVFETNPKECVSREVNMMTYFVCKHDSRHQLVDWGKEFYSIRFNEEENEFPVVLGCSDNTHLNNICVVRSKYNDLLQIEYSYPKGNESKSHIIEGHIRTVIDKLHK